jgi:hypothetical protein
MILTAENAKQTRRITPPRPRERRVVYLQTPLGVLGASAVKFPKIFFFAGWVALYE